MIYLIVTAGLLAAAFIREPSRPVALVLAINMLATIFLQETVAYHAMTYVDGLAFNAIVLAVLHRPKWWNVASAVFMGLSCVVHLAYYGLGESRYDYGYWHMYSLQALYLAAVVAVLFGGFDVRQFVASILDRIRGLRHHPSGVVCARSGDCSTQKEA